MSNTLKLPLEIALARIGQDAAAKQAVIDVLKDCERRNERPGEELRETTSGLVTDALHGKADWVTKSITIALSGSGTPMDTLSFSLLYRSKVGREFAMSEDSLDRVWEPQTTKLLLSLARDAQAALIGGAYAGDHAILMMKQMAPRGGICHCFEPNKEQSRMLEKNASANGLTNYTLLNEGIWSKTTKLGMVGIDSHAHPEEFSGQSGEVFQAVSIDDYCHRHGIAKLDIIMLDIEGGESEALTGARRFLTAPAEMAPDVIFEIHRTYVDWSNGLASTPICSLLLDNGYLLYAIRDYQGNVSMTGAPVEVVSIDTCYLVGPPHGFNIFATKRSESIFRHNLQICHGVSPKLLHHRDPAMHQPLSR